MAERKKLERFTSPVGVAVFPKLNTPDTKFKAEGEYSVKLRLPADDAGTKAMVKRIDALLAKARAEAEGKAKKGQKVKDCDPPYKVVYDDQENETGELEFKVAAKASGTTREGKTWERKLALFDRFGKPTTEIVRGGAKIVVSYAPDGWVNPKLEYGVKLYLEAVQVRENGGSARSASEYGFAMDAPPEDDETTGGDEGGDEGNGGAAETPDF